MRALAIACLLVTLIGCRNERGAQDAVRDEEEKTAPTVGQASENMASEQSSFQEDESQSNTLVQNASAPETAADPPEAETFALKPRQRVMPGLVNYYRPLRIQLSETPQEKLVAEPDYVSDTPLYGVLTAGDAPDNQISIVVDEVDPENSRIYIDRNNDEDLTNDGPGKWSRNTSGTLGLSNVSVDVPYGADVIPAMFEFYRFKTRLKDVVLYYRNSAREGTMRVGDAEYQIAVLDENADGRYDDLDNGTLLIDLDQDGQLHGGSDSAEHHALDQPFNIHGNIFQVASLSADGTQLTISPSSAEVEMRAYLTAGNPAPHFAGKTLNDEAVDLLSLSEEADYVLLDFWASWCGPCRKEYPYLRRLHARYKDHGLRIIGVNLDSSRDKAIQAAQDNLLNYPHVFDGQGWKNAVAVLYRVHGIPATYLLDKDLNIVARGLRGESLERRMFDLLGRGDVEAAEKLEEGVSKREPLSSPPVRSRPANRVGQQVLSKSQNQYARNHFESVTLSQARKAALSSDRINGSDDGKNNKLLPGTVLIAKTSQGRFAKLMIQEYGYNLTISWVTYDDNGKPHSQGSDLKIRGTWSCDLDSGQEASEDSDFWWQQVTKTERYITPKNGAQFVVLGRFINGKADNTTAE